MATNIKMPRQGNTVESCIIATWHKNEGDEVKTGDVLFTYETDKATFDYESEIDGVLLKILREEDDEVPVLEDVCIIGDADEKDSVLANEDSDSDQSSKAKEETTKKDEEKTSPKEDSSDIEVSDEKLENTIETDDGKMLKISPRAQNLAKKEGVNPTLASATGPYGRIIEKDIIELAKNGPKATKAAYEDFKKDSYKEGTGLSGRITTKDIEKGPDTESKEKETKVATKADYEDVKLSNVRKVIAKSMHASLQNTAQLTLNSSFDATDILNFRKKIKAKMEDMNLSNITLNDIVLYATTKVLENHKDLNAHFLDDKIRLFKNVNLGIAVDTNRGLLVPTLFDANTLSLNELSLKSKALISDAQDGKISPDLLSGGTFTVTNLGALGVESFTPVLNPPQTGILGVDNITYRTRKTKDGFENYPAMGLSLTFDHRAVDGAPAAKFLKELASTLENFSLLLTK